MSKHNYEPPKRESKPFDWVETAKLPNHFIPKEEINKRLTETFGDPTERVYDGEPASEFGLKPDSDVLEWRKIVGCWTCVSFYLLTLGTIWRKMPPLLTTNKGGEV